MPTYNYQCETCDSIFEEIKPISKMKDSPVCCGVHTKQIILSAPAIDAQFLGSAANPGYVSPLSGKFIDSSRARNNEMREHNVVPKE